MSLQALLAFNQFNQFKNFQVFLKVSTFPLEWLIHQQHYPIFNQLIQYTSKHKFKGSFKLFNYLTSFFQSFLCHFNRLSIST